MYKGSKPKIVPILIAVIIIALIVAALVSLGRMLFTSNTTTNRTNPTTESEKIRTDLLDTSNGRAVRFTERGPIIADEEFKSYQIVITPTTRTYTTYNGYLDRVIGSKVYQNNDKAYEELVYALDKASVYKVRDTQGVDDYRGACATNGRLYILKPLTLILPRIRCGLPHVRGHPATWALHWRKLKLCLPIRCPTLMPDLLNAS